MTIWMQNPPAEATGGTATGMETSLPDVVPKAPAHDASSGPAAGQPHTEDRELVVLVDHDNLAAQLKGILGRPPYPEERMLFRKLREFFTQWLPGHAGDKIACNWFLHDWNTSRLADLVDRLDREHLGPKTLGRNQPTARNCACSALLKAIEHLAGQNVDLLVGSSCRRVIGPLISAARERPDRRVGLLGYREVLPRDYQGTGIDLLDVEYDAKAHAPSISREFASAGSQFDPATHLSRS